MGLVLLTVMVKVGFCESVSLTGMKPEKKPVTLDMMLLIGTHGLAKLDCTTEWFCIPCQRATSADANTSGGTDLRVELELDLGARRSLDVIRRVGELPTGADLDHLHLGSGPGSHAAHVRGPSGTRKGKG